MISRAQFPVSLLIWCIATQLCALHEYPNFSNSQTSLLLNFPNGDICSAPAEIIVNATNRVLGQGGGVCGAIFKAAGSELLTTYIDTHQLAPLKEGEIAITPSFDLRSSYAHTIVYIIHAVGPRYRGGRQEEADKLYNLYYQSLLTAHQFRAKSIAFPAISTGTFCYPKEEAARIALRAVRTFLDDYPTTSVKEIYFCFPKAIDGRAFQLCI